ncbi:MAG TPA: peptidoglycan-binding protein, partial [Acidothermaceae bacterium]
MQQQHERVDEPLRLGDRGLAVLELRHRLRQLGLLINDETRAGQSSEAADLFDEACDHAVRSFQQQRGLRIDGVVDRETYRGLDEARWRLGDRTLSFAVRHPYVGDDVAGLQHRLTDMGFDCGRADGVFGPRT